MVVIAWPAGTRWGRLRRISATGGLDLDLNFGLRRRARWSPPHRRGTSKKKMNRTEWQVKGKLRVVIEREKRGEEVFLPTNIQWVI